MVTILPKEEGWGNVGREFGQGVVKGHQQSSDQKAIQNAVSSLPPDATPRQIVDAITNTKTYSPEAKQAAIKNYVGAAEFEQTERKIAAEKEQKKAEGEAKDKKESDKLTKEREKAEAETRQTRALYKTQHPDATDEEIAEATKDLKPADIRATMLKPENITEYDVASNHAKRLEPLVKKIDESGEKAKDLIIPTEAAIVNNEKYTEPERWLDALVGKSGGWLDILKSKTGQQLEAYTPIAIQTFSDRMSGVLSVKKINVIEKKAVNPIKDKETNRLFLYLDYGDRKLDILRKQEMDRIISKNKYGLPPKDLNEQLNEYIEPYRKQFAADISLLLDGKKPKSGFLTLSTIEKKKQGAQPDEVFVIGPNGEEGYLQKSLLGTPDYAGFKQYD